MFLNIIAYFLLIMGVILKSWGLYVLASQKDKPFEERKKIYSKYNWSANLLLVLGIIILTILWYL